MKLVRIFPLMAAMFAISAVVTQAVGVKPNAKTSPTPSADRVKLPEIFNRKPREIWISADRTDGKGQGTQSDPFDAHTQSNFQSAINTVSAGSTIRMADGTYPKMSLTISKSVTLSGTRNVIITPASGANKPIFALSGVDTHFTLNGISLIHGTAYAEENNVAAIRGGCGTLRLIGIYSRDFNNTIYVTEASTKEVDVEGCQFEYTYGRASVSNVSPYKHPCAAIAGNPKRLIVKNNRFNGLLDPTFTGVSKTAPASQREPADNFVQTGDHDYCLVEGNTVENFGIEGIFIARGNVSSSYSCRIANNDLVGPVYHNSNVWGYYTPGVKLWRTRGEIIGNTVRNVTIGISAEFASYNSIENVVMISGNTITKSITGIEGVLISDNSIISSNTVWNASEPVRTVFGQGSTPTELYGIVCDHGNVSNNTLLSDEPVWDATATLNSRSRNVFELSSVGGITANTGALVSYANGGVAIFPVQRISGNTVTVNANYANNYPDITSGTLYYAGAFANGVSNGGIVVRAGGTVYADGNVVIGHRNDISQQNSGSIIVANHRARNCHVIKTNVAGLFTHEPASRIWHGTVTLRSGVATVNDSSVTANTRILVTRNGDDGTVGCTYSVTRIAGTSFTIISKNSSGATQGADASTIAYELIEP